MLHGEQKKNDLKTWVSENFSLDSGQANFLTNLTDDWLTAAGGQLNVALLYRLDVSIVIGTPPNPDLPPWVQGKWINYHEVPIFTNNSGTATATGSLRFEIGYKGF